MIRYDSFLFAVDTIEMIRYGPKRYEFDTKMPCNGRLAPAGEGLLGRKFVFVVCSFTFFVAYFESLSLPGRLLDC